jgi:hypothetical protein
MRLFYGQHWPVQPSMLRQGFIGAPGRSWCRRKTNQSSRSRQSKVSGLPRCRRSWQRREAAVESQEPPRCSHFAQNLWVVLADLDPLWLTTACGSRRLPRTQFALCTSNHTYVISPIRPFGLSLIHEALCRPSGTTRDIVHAERRVADHRANIVLTIATAPASSWSHWQPALQLPAP